MDFSNLRERLSFLPHVKVSTSELGGHSSVFIHASMDHKDTWANSIFHNSRYGIFRIADGKIELISRGLNAPKFRKSNAKDLDSIVTKLQSWVDKAN